MLNVDHTILKISTQIVKVSAKMNEPGVFPGLGMGGEGEIRTREGFQPLAVFETAAFNRSATSPSVSASGAPWRDE